MLLTEALAGMVGGVAGIMVGSPLDVIKTRAMMNGGSEGMWTALRAVWAREGLRSLFKGSIAVSLAQMPNNFVVFGAWAQGKHVLSTRNVFGIADARLKADVDVYLAGSYSGFTQALVLAPFEHIKVQQQLYVKGQLSLAACARHLLQARGVAGLCRGTVATLWRDAPTFGLYFVTFEKIKAAASSPSLALSLPQLGEGRRNAGDNVNPAAAAAARPDPQTGPILFAGACAGVVSWSFAIPADVVKSAIQGAPIDAPPRDVRMLTVIRRLYAAGGMPVFFRGAVPCLVRAAPVNAVTFLGYEWAHNVLHPLLQGGPAQRETT